MLRYFYADVRGSSVCSIQPPKIEACHCRETFTCAHGKVSTKDGVGGGGGGALRFSAYEIGCKHVVQHTAMRVWG